MHSTSKCVCISSRFSSSFWMKHFLSLCFFIQKCRKGKKANCVKHTHLYTHIWNETEAKTKTQKKWSRNNWSYGKKKEKNTHIRTQTHTHIWKTFRDVRAQTFHMIRAQRIKAKEIKLFKTQNNNNKTDSTVFKLLPNIHVFFHMRTCYGFVETNNKILYIVEAKKTPDFQFSVSVQIW